MVCCGWVELEYYIKGQEVMSKAHLTPSGDIQVNNWMNISLFHLAFVLYSFPDMSVCVCVCVWLCQTSSLSDSRCLYQCLAELTKHFGFFFLWNSNSIPSAWGQAGRRTSEVHRWRLVICGKVFFSFDWEAGTTLASVEKQNTVWCPQAFWTKHMNLAFQLGLWFD